ncbi:MAG: hypothetical protein AAFQ68_20575 [Bacteroidota bacterium]
MQSLKKNFPAFLLLAMLFSVYSCEQIAEQFEFDFDLKLPAVEFDVALVAEAGEVVMVDQTVKAELGEWLKEHDATTERVLSLLPKRFYMEIVEPLNLSFDPVERLSLYLSAPGQPEFLLAELDPVSNGFHQWVELDILDKPEMMEYLQGGEFNVRLVGLYTEPVDEKMTIRTYFEFDARAHQ